jgi:hypothetical protein
LEQQERILREIEKRSFKNGKQSFVLGDFNINWNSEEYKNSPFFDKGEDSYNEGRLEVSESAATNEAEYLCRRNWDHEEHAKPQNLILDYFLSFFKGSDISVKTKKIATFDVGIPSEAISDHAALVTNVTLNILEEPKKLIG